MDWMTSENNYKVIVGRVFGDIQRSVNDSAKDFVLETMDAFNI